MTDSVAMVRTDHEQLESYRALISRIAGVPGPVACEQLALCYWAGKSFEIDFFNYGQKLKKHRVAATLLESRLADGYYALIETTGSPVAESATATYLGPELAGRLGARYIPVAAVETNTLLAPISAAMGHADR